MKPHLIGYWYSIQSNDSQKYPDPKRLPTTNNIDTSLIHYLKSGKQVNFYRGSSRCRLCNARLGSSERTDGVFIWPDGLDHYISEHKIKLPDYFLKHVAKSTFSPDHFDCPSHIEKDESRWLEYYKDVISSNEVKHIPSVQDEMKSRLSQQIRKEMDADILYRLLRDSIQ